MNTKILKFNNLFQNKKYKKCLKLGKKILDKLNPNSNLFYLIIKNQGIVFYHLKRYNEAVKYLELISNCELNDKELFEINYYLFLSYYETRNYHKIIEYGLKTVEYKDIDLSEKAKILSVIGRYHYLLYLISNKKVYLIRGLYYNSESQKYFEETNNLDCSDYLYALYDCADIYMGLEDYDAAINYYEKVETMTKNRDLLQNIYDNLALIYKEKGYLETMMYYKQKLSSLT